MKHTFGFPTQSFPTSIFDSWYLQRCSKPSKMFKAVRPQTTLVWEICFLLQEFWNFNIACNVIWWKCCNLKVTFVLYPLQLYMDVEHMCFILKETKFMLGITDLYNGMIFFYFEHKLSSPEAYGALEQPPLNRGSTPFFGVFEQSTPFVWHFSHFWLYLRSLQYFVRHLRILLTWLSLGYGSDTMLGITTLHSSGMILSTLSINSHSFALGFPKRSHANGDVFLYL